MSAEFTIILPTLNEGGNILGMLSILQKLYPDSEILVIDDGSTDATQEIVRSFAKRRKGVRLIDHSKARVKGLTASVIDGIRHTKTKKFVVMDADFQHPPEIVGQIVRKLENYELVIGRRVSLSGWSGSRRLISSTASILANFRLFISGKGILKDPMSGFFGARRHFFMRLIKSCNFIPDGFKVLFDALKCIPPGTHIGYVNYEFVGRRAGESKLKAKQILCVLRSLIT